MSNENALFDKSYESAIRDLEVAQKRVAELEAENAEMLALLANRQQEWQRAVDAEEATRKRIAELEAQIVLLRRIAYCANKLDGGATSDEQWHEILQAQRKAMEPFTDDAFNELKKTV